MSISNYCISYVFFFQAEDGIRDLIVTGVQTCALPISMTRALALLALVLTAGVAAAGGSNYGIAPGARPQVEGRISEWKVPTPQFARDPAPGPDGNIYIAVMFGNKIARVDPRAKTFTEWALPAGAP